MAVVDPIISAFIGASADGGGMPFLHASHAVLVRTQSQDGSDWRERAFAAEVTRLEFMTKAAHVLGMCAGRSLLNEVVHPQLVEKALLAAAVIADCHNGARTLACEELCGGKFIEEVCIPAVLDTMLEPSNAAGNFSAAHVLKLIRVLAEHEATAARLTAGMCFFVAQCDALLAPLTEEQAGYGKLRARETAVTLMRSPHHPSHRGLYAAGLLRAAKEVCFTAAGAHAILDKTVNLIAFGEEAELPRLDLIKQGLALGRTFAASPAVQLAVFWAIANATGNAASAAARKLRNDLAYEAPTFVEMCRLGTAAVTAFPEHATLVARVADVLYVTAVNSRALGYVAALAAAEQGTLDALAATLPILARRGEAPAVSTVLRALATVSKHAAVSAAMGAGMPGCIERLLEHYTLPDTPLPPDSVLVGAGALITQYSHAQPQREALQRAAELLEDVSARVAGGADAPAAVSPPAT
jgi:hypothetical protein